MYTTNGNEVLEFQLKFRVARKLKKGFLGIGAKSEDFVILNNVQGRIESGTMTALLGASGCGKSTLLAALSQRLRGKLSGEIRFNGEVMNRTKMTNVAGFVPQNDVCVEGLTVREHFYFMIELKLPQMSSREKSFLIESSLIKFHLDGGTNLKLLSGGEKRKLSLASELLTKPKILFCDEPTSGLDSFSAFAVMNTLRELSGYNEPKLFEKHLSPSRIVLFSIHQPTSDIFYLFTNIMLMSAGRIIFHGTVQEAQAMFNNIGLHCPPLYNPAEFYVNRISDRKVAEEILKHEIHKKNIVMDESPQKSTEGFEETQRARVSWLRQVVLLSHRGTLNFLHNPKHYLIELLILIIFSLLIVAVFSGVSLKSESAVQDVKGFLIILATEVLFTFVYVVFTMVYEFLPLLRKETGDRLYSFSAYYVSLVVMMIPRVVFETLIYTAIIYFSVDIGRDFMTYLNFSMSIALSGACAMAYGFFLSGLFESFFIGTELSSIVDLVLLLSSGIYTTVQSVPLLKYTSFFFYANESIAIYFWLQVKKIECSPNPEFTCFPDGYAVLESQAFGTNLLDIYKNYGYQLGLTCLLHVLAFFGIRRNIRKAGFY